MVILYCGEMWDGGTCRMRRDVLRELGHIVEDVDTTHRHSYLRHISCRVAQKFSWARDPERVNEALLEAASRQNPDVVWIDKGLPVLPSTLQRLRDRQPSVRIVHYCLDDMGCRWNQSRQYQRSIPHYDLHVTTKQYHIPELQAKGAKATLRVRNAFSPDVHRPLELTDQERACWGGPAGFIGCCEDDRAQAILRLAEHGIRVRVWGSGWTRWSRKHRHPNLVVENRCVLGEAYAKAICAFDINLGFLSKLSHADLSTTRSLEIPACGAFLLAERTTEHQDLFREGIEAEFFGDEAELLEKCRYYLAHASERVAIAAAGRRRCVESDYSYRGQMALVLEHLTGLRPQACGCIS